MPRVTKADLTVSLEASLRRVQLLEYHNKAFKDEVARLKEENAGLKEEDAGLKEENAALSPGQHLADGHLTAYKPSQKFPET